MEKVIEITKANEVEMCDEIEDVDMMDRHAWLIRRYSSREAYEAHTPDSVRVDMEIVDLEYGARHVSWGDYDIHPAGAVATDPRWQEYVMDEEEDGYIFDRLVIDDLSQEEYDDLEDAAADEDIDITEAAHA